MNICQQVFYQVETYMYAQYFISCLIMIRSVRVPLLLTTNSFLFPFVFGELCLIDYCFYCFISRKKDFNGIIYKII